MYKRSRLLFAALLAAASFSAPQAAYQAAPAPSPAAAAAPTVSHLNVPLVVIRFNEPRIYFERPLYNALRKALETKPGVRLNVINYFPTTNQNLVDEAEANLNKVMKVLQEMGMPLNRIGVSSEPASDLKNSEVHIYVR